MAEVVNASYFCVNFDGISNYFFESFSVTFYLSREVLKSKVGILNFLFDIIHGMFLVFSILFLS